MNSRINFAGRSWDFVGNADGVTITECTGPMNVPVRNINIPTEIHLSFCKCLKSSAKDSYKVRSSSLQNEGDK